MNITEPRLIMCHFKTCKTDFTETLIIKLDRLTKENDFLKAENSGYGLNVEELSQERDTLREQYSDLIMQVVNVVPNETRHESARRIIHNHENQDNEECAALNHMEG